MLAYDKNNLGQITLQIIDVAMNIELGIFALGQVHSTIAK